ncbi:MAG: HAMP domain-containing sensor histidine kinase [Bacteroidia bacterium]|nr:HAMP domain-containing sensor histidine kinase [Bacteroidia bacterium]
MKLLVKLTFYYLVITLVIFGLGGVMTFNIIRQTVVLELDRYLRHELRKVYAAIEQDVPINALNRSNLQILQLQEDNPIETGITMTDTVVYHIYLKRNEPNRKATVIKEIKGNYYHITIFDQIVEDDDIYDSLVVGLSRMYILLTIVVILSGLILSKKLLDPFEATLRKIKTFHIQDHQPLEFPKTHTKEFRNLNNFITLMTTKARHDYLNLKEFTENAAHEMQTPLAIAKGKLELLLESSQLDEEQIHMVNSAYMAINKLSRMGNSLALLTKIENMEFANLREINFSEMLEEKLFDFRELIEMREIRLKTEIEPEVKTVMDPMLLDILLTNLLQNAIRHNIENGIIDIHLNNKGLTIKNTGHPPVLPPEQMFERFKKNKQSGESNGLGLSIVKKICEVNQFVIRYDYHSDWHEVSLGIRG